MSQLIPQNRPGPSSGAAERAASCLCGSVLCVSEEAAADLRSVCEYITTLHLCCQHAAPRLISAKHRALLRHVGHSSTSSTLCRPAVIDVADIRMSNRCDYLPLQGAGRSLGDALFCFN